MEGFNKIKDAIVNKYLIDPNLHETQKKAIRIFIKIYKLYFEEFDEYAEPEYKEFTIEFGDFVCHEISKFSNIDLLNTFNFLASIKHDIKVSFYVSCFALYRDLSAFKDSGIDEKNYYDAINSIKKKVANIQKYSSMTIELDKLPQHPSNLIRQYMHSNELTLDEINVIVEAVNYRMNGEYKIKPMPTKDEIEQNRKVKLQYLEMCRKELIIFEEGEHIPQNEDEITEEMLSFFAEKMLHMIDKEEKSKDKEKFEKGLKIATFNYS